MRAAFKAKAISLLIAVALSFPNMANGQVDPAVTAAVRNSETMAKCQAEARRQLPDPATYRLDRARSQQPTTDGTWSWMFAFDAATKKGGAGHYSAFCTENKDGTVNVVVA